MIRHGNVSDDFSMPYEISEDAAKATRLQPLRLALDSDEREIRIWINYAFGESQTFYRVTAHDHEVQGNVFFYWPKELYFGPDGKVDQRRSAEKSAEIRRDFGRRCVGDRGSCRIG